MKKQTPNSLYKYFSFNDYSIKAFELGSVWLSNPSTFNDPYDCAITIDQIKYIERQKNYYEAMYPREGKERDLSVISKAPIPGWVISVAKADLQKKCDSIGVCSFSEDNLSLLMWSHYADSHRGFCVEYECSDGIASSEFCKVNYVSEIPSVTIEEYNHYNESERRGYINKLAVYKSNHWDYEREWRLITDYNNSYYKGNIKIKSIYLGARSDASVRKQLEGIMKNNQSILDVKIHQITRLENSFELKVRPY